MSKGTVSDGYHTFQDLYEHRHALFCYLVRCGVFESGYAVLEHYPAWDLVVLTIDGKQLSYHLPISHRHLWETHLNTVSLDEHVWDGHTSNDVIARLNGAKAPPGTYPSGQR